MSPKSSFAKSFALNIILPTFIAITLFTVSIFYIIIPTSKKHILDRKREMIRELTNSTWNLLESYHQKEITGELTTTEAQEKAVSVIRTLRYGPENKDYFWVTDMTPRMIIHPYRNDLNGKDLSVFEDSHGKKLFVEFVRIVRQNDSGFLDYWWQWKDDASRVVPKLSYVRSFEPWGWIIGTGIYIEDERAEIARVTNKLIYISISIIFLISLILFYIARQSLRIEKRKQTAENELAQSKEKYKTLVEASTEGTLMILDNKIIFANQTILDMLGFKENELTQMNISGLVSKKNKNNSDFHNYFEDARSAEIPKQFEVQLAKKDGSTLQTLVSISHINIFNKQGSILVAKDMSSQKKMQDELGESKLKLQMLTDNINIGIFRIQAGKNPQFVEMNPACKRILGIKKNETINSPITNFFLDKTDAKIFIGNLLNEESVKNRIVQLKRLDGGKAVVNVSAILIKDNRGKNAFIDGIIEDVSELKKTEQAREEMIVELQTSLTYLNQPVKSFAKQCLRINMNVPIKMAAQEMRKNKVGACLVVSDVGETIGLLTADDLWERVVCTEKNLKNPVYEIMTAPIMSISENALLFEALLVMQEKLIRRLPLSDNNGKISGIITNKEIIQIQQYSAGLLVQEINNAESVDKIIERSKTLPQLVKYLVDGGLLTPNITRIICSVGDAVAAKFLKFAISDIGEPPVKFAFLALGSQGREEQTLVTDQDNVIVYENTEKNVRDYFLKLAEKVNGWLNEAGYNFCEGDVMAKNPKWCVSIDEWKKYFSHWINEAEPQDLLDISIFFDFRLLHGDIKLIEELKRHISIVSKDKSGFFNHLAKNALLVKPPINLIGNIVVKSSEERHDAFDIKHSLMPIVDFARIYCLRHNVDATNTLRRLQKLYDKDIINKSTFEEMVECYNYLMKLRFKHQTENYQKNRKLNNFINPKRLTQIEQHMLKKIFSQISSFQKKLSFDFTGEM